MTKRSNMVAVCLFVVVFGTACSSTTSSDDSHGKKGPDAGGAEPGDADASTKKPPASEDAGPMKTPADGGMALDAAIPQPTVDTLFFLDILGGRVLSMRPDGTEDKVLVPANSNPASSGPDGIAVDVKAGFIYWTNMGGANLDDGSILRAKLDGSEVTTIVAPGGTFTPKQLRLDAEGGKLYWSDREGMRIMRANLDGTKIETLVITGSGATDRADAAHWCVGIALDVEKKLLYWTQKGPDNGGVGTIKRAGMELPKGDKPESRSDIEVLFEGLPEPVDIDLDTQGGLLYWTDRGDDTINRAAIEIPKGSTAANRKDREVLVKGVSEAIGVSLDLDGGNMFYTQLTGGVVGMASLDGSNAKTIASGKGGLTGIAFVQVPE